jgi:hypothetical protein
MQIANNFEIFTLAPLHSTYSLHGCPCRAAIRAKV